MSYYLEYKGTGDDWHKLGDAFKSIHAAIYRAHVLSHQPGYPTTPALWHVRCGENVWEAKDWHGNSFLVKGNSMPPKRWFKRKKTVISAEQFTAEGKVPEGVKTRYDHSKHREYYVTTAQGQDVVVNYSEWIVPEPQGREGYYPIKDDIFRATYESISETEEPNEAVSGPDDLDHGLIHDALKGAARVKADFGIKVMNPWETVAALRKVPPNKRLMIGDDIFTADELLNAIIVQECEDEF